VFGVTEGVKKNVGVMLETFLSSEVMQVIQNITLFIQTLSSHPVRAPVVNMK
jgi:hypothetical protein